MSQNQTNHRFEKRLNNTFLVLFILCLIGVSILTISNTPPALQLNVWQALILNGDYYPALTILLLVFPLVIVLVIVKTILALIFNLFFVKEGEPKIPYAYKIRWR